MTTLKYFSKIFFRYIFMLMLSLFAAFLVFVFGIYVIYNGFVSQESAPSVLAEHIIQEDSYHISQSTKEVLDDNDIWLMVLDEQGNIADSYHLPEKLHHSYNLIDIAKSTRWYLEDYPVFSYVAGNHLVLLGYPKNSYSRLPANYFQITQLFRFIFLLAVILILLVVVYFVLYARAKLMIRKEFAPITQGLDALSNDQIVILDEKGNLSEIKSAINQASQLLAENRDMRSHWIRGVSHDLRNPLTLMLGYTHQLQANYGEEKSLQQIEANIHRMESIISNLNMSYLLENRSLDKDMKKINISGLLRQIIADMYNHYPDIDLTFQLPEKDLFVLGEATLLTRAIHNLLLNSVTHNENPIITIELQASQQNLLLSITDNGTISEAKVLELSQKNRNYKPHGMGVIISKQIISLHHGHIDFQYAHPGLKCQIVLPAL